MTWINSLKDNLPNLTQDKIDNLHRPTSIKEIKSIINNLPKHKAPVQMVSLQYVPEDRSRRNTSSLILSPSLPQYHNLSEPSVAQDYM